MRPPVPWSAFARTVLFWKRTSFGSIEIFPPPPGPSETERLRVLSRSRIRSVAWRLMSPPLACLASVVIELFPMRSSCFPALIEMVPASAGPVLMSSDRSTIAESHLIRRDYIDRPASGAWSGSCCRGRNGSAVLKCDGVGRNDNVTSCTYALSIAEYAASGPSIITPVPGFLMSTVTVPPWPDGLFFSNPIKLLLESIPPSLSRRLSVKRCR